MARLSNRIRPVIGGLCIALLAGCLGAPAPLTRYYVLNPTTGGDALVADASARRELSVEIASLHLPQYLERPHLVTREGDNRLVLAEFHQWGGNLRKDMVRVLSQNLSRLLATPKISVSPYGSLEAPDFRLYVDVHRFEWAADGRIHLSARWRVAGGRDARPLTTRISELESAAVISSGDFETAVGAMGTVLGELSRVIGAEILAHATDASGS